MKSNFLICVFENVDSIQHNCLRKIPTLSPKTIYKNYEIKIEKIFNIDSKWIDAQTKLRTFSSIFSPSSPNTQIGNR